MITESYISNMITERAVKCLNLLPLELLQSDECFRIAGGCLVMDKPNDYDIFTSSPYKMYLDYFEKDDKYTLVNESKNALTLKTHKGKIIQLCNYWFTTLKEQIEAFDFAHIMVGVEVQNLDSNGSFFTDSYSRVTSVYWQDPFIEAMVSGRTWIANADLNYPMATAIRAKKYADRGLMNKSEYCVSMILAMSQVYKRGIKSYDDFKDQLDAVDLGFIFEENGRTSQMLKQAFDNFGAPTNEVEND